MSSHPIAAVVCALLAAALFAVAAVAQHRAAATVPEGVGFVGALVRDPRWLAGIAGDVGGYAMQVAALALGSVLLVQPLLVSALIFALPLSARLNGRRIDAGTWATAGALTVALAVFLIVGDPSEGVATAPFAEWAVPLGALLAGLAAVVAVGARSADPTRRALLFGVAGGSLFGLAAALTTGVTDLFGRGVGAALGSWQLWALVASGVAGLYLQQRAYQVGPLTASLPAVTIAEPLAAALIGTTVLDERLRTGPLGLAVVAVSVIVMCATTIRLSRGQARS
ncbi:DMT family transporter [Nocardia bovistercoris]|uniref:DMT family transporter n=1 Tax=Nocardia bovistercoris TaxID=2785916 RepID=A0A931I9B3_9NOCA|nr:DMT family transporter [Nocardia bovistercoris]